MDDGDTYVLQCRADDSLCNGALTASMDTISDNPPDTTVFEDVSEATKFVLKHVGSCGFNFAQEKLSFQEIEYPDWDVSFCHECSLDSSLVDHLATAYDLDLTFDCTLYMADVDQTWKRAWLYEPTDVNANTTGDRATLADD